MTAFTFGLGEVVLFPYVLVEESAGAVADTFCITVTYDDSQLVKGYVHEAECQSASDLEKHNK